MQTRRQGEVVLKYRTKNNRVENTVTFPYYDEEERERTRHSVTAMRDGLRTANYHADAFDVSRNGDKIP